MTGDHLGSHKNRSKVGTTVGLVSHLATYQESAVVVHLSQRVKEGLEMPEDRRTTYRPSQAATPSAAAAAAQVLSQLTDLARTTVQIHASLAKQSVDLTWATMAGTVDRTSANKAYVAAVTRESARFWREVGGLGLHYATDLVTLGKSVATSVLRDVAAAGRKPGTRHTSGDVAGSHESAQHHRKVSVEVRS